MPSLLSVAARAGRAGAPASRPCSARPAAPATAAGASRYACGSPAMTWSSQGTPAWFSRWAKSTSSSRKPSIDPTTTQVGGRPRQVRRPGGRRVGRDVVGPEALAEIRTPAEVVGRRRSRRRARRHRWTASSGGRRASGSRATGRPAAPRHGRAPAGRAPPPARRPRSGRRSRCRSGSMPSSSACSWAQRSAE